MVEPIDTSKLGPITALPSASDELAKAVDAIQAAEGALNRAIPACPDVIRGSLAAELVRLRSSRQAILLLRGGPKAEPVHFVGANWLP